jgi:hypothetical protein
MWKRVAEGLGVEAAESPGEPNPLDGRLDHADEVWAGLVERYGLQPYKASDLASWWHTDADLGRQVETFADMSRSRARASWTSRIRRDHSWTCSTLFEHKRSSRR